MIARDRRPKRPETDPVRAYQLAHKSYLDAERHKREADALVKQEKGLRADGDWLEIADFLGILDPAVEVARVRREKLTGAAVKPKPPLSLNGWEPATARDQDDDPEAKQAVRDHERLLQAASYLDWVCLMHSEEHEARAAHRRALEAKAASRAQLAEAAAALSPTQRAELGIDEVETQPDAGELNRGGRVRHLLRRFIGRKATHSSC